jgi:hypothetical protein
MTEIDHVAEAVRLAQLGEKSAAGTVSTEDYARLAQVHATLSLSDPNPELDHVRAAGRELLAALADENDHDPASSRRVDDAREALWPLVREVTA